eukprot:CAMPEP_0196768958 /NCGR_PEP_ID=MMETSP1104-20130614/233_1 /TAXON_ID=33652 /ORGANISM="Cafeteria sp., Strain Caron Lab Isolate" /LENGTH=932 /DNA_ID=CAMNT_0042139039 /DNA_START=47 /DNA_END=2845 /DNA_ORIENTATION=+
MEFASNFVFYNEEEDEGEAEEVDFMDLASELTPSTEEAARAAPLPPRASGRSRGRGGGGAREASKKSKRSRRPRGTPVYRRHLDTNVLRLRLGSLGSVATVATGDVTRCRGCGAAFSCHSKLGAESSEETKAGEESKAGAAEAKAGEEAKASEEAKAEATTAATADAAATAEEGEGEDADQDDRWSCEFCGTVNLVDLDPAERPTQSTVDYLLEAPSGEDAAAAAAARADPASQPVTLFVLDVSGSMCVATEMEGVVALKGDRRGSMRGLRTAGDSGDQHLPGERRDVTYVSRLQAIQAAVNQQLESMARETPTWRAGLITFNEDVRVVGDGSAPTQVLAGDRLADYEHLKSAGEDYPLARPVSESRASLVERLFALEEGGQTALGPAAVVAVHAAARVRGSRVVICTDGASNVGLGKLEELSSDAQREEASAFYRALGERAQAAGVIVDVVGIEGQCDLETLGQLAELSGGEVTKVDPVRVHSNFAGMLARPVLATGVKASLFLHRGMQFKHVDEADQLITEVLNDEADEEEEGEEGGGAAEGAAEGATGGEGEAAAEEKDESKTADKAAPAPAPAPAPVPASAPASEAAPAPASAAPASAPAPTARADPTAAMSGSRLTRVVGNVNEDTEVTFEYGVRPLAERRAMGIERVSKLPFQVQIEFTKLDGSRLLRVITLMRPVTHDRAQAAREADMALLGSHAAQQSAMLAQRGDYETSLANTRMWTNFMAKNSLTPAQRASHASYVEDVSALDSALQSAMASEAPASHALALTAVAEEEDEDEAEMGEEARASRGGGIGGFFSSLFGRRGSGAPPQQQQQQQARVRARGGAAMPPPPPPAPSAAAPGFDAFAFGGEGGGGGGGRMRMEMTSESSSPWFSTPSAASSAAAPPAVQAERRKARVTARSTTNDALSSTIRGYASKGSAARSRKRK